MNEPIVEVTRGDLVESRHWGAIAVVDTQGKVVASYGDPGFVTFMRSSAKPLQALPFVERGGDISMGLGSEELAIMCSSHSGTDEHVRVVTSLQAKAGVSEADLLCGTHPPYHQPTQQELLLRGEKPTPNRHNCSGKHSGMLAHARLRGLPLADYINPNHPIQVSILNAFAEMCYLAPEEIAQGTDGCSAPNFAVPLCNAAWAYARLMDPSGLADNRADACRRITAAMLVHPNLVSGPGRFDRVLMEVGRGRILAKAGAEGYQAIGLAPGALQPGSPALGICFKIADGDPSSRARPLVAVEALRQLGALSAEDLTGLADFDRRPIYNQRHLAVGELRACFRLES